jgi:hypothetical protein
MTAKPLTISIQVDAPFAALEKPLPVVRIEVGDAVAFDGPLVTQGNRMSHLFYAKGSATIPADARTFELRFRIESQSIDERVILDVARGRWVVIARGPDGKPRFTQYTTRPLYR